MTNSISSKLKSQTSLLPPHPTHPPPSRASRSEAVRNGSVTEPRGCIFHARQGVQQIGRREAADCCLFYKPGGCWKQTASDRPRWRLSLRTSSCHSGHILVCCQMGTFSKGPISILPFEEKEAVAPGRESTNNRCCVVSG